MSTTSLKGFAKKIKFLWNRDLSISYLLNSLLIITIATIIFIPLFIIFPWTGYLYVFDLTIIVALILFVVRIWKLFFAHSIETTDILRLLEKQEAIAHAPISIAYELNCSPNRSKSNLYDATIQRAESLLKKKQLTIHGLINKKKVIATMGCIILAVTFSIISEPNIFKWIHLPLQFFAKGTLCTISGSMAIPKYASVKLYAAAKGVDYPIARLTFWPIDGSEHKSQTFFCRRDSMGHYCYNQDSCATSFLYQFDAGKNLGTIETVSVIDPPKVISLSIKVSPPKYTKIAPHTLSDGDGLLNLYSGSYSEISIRSHYSLLTAAIIVNENDTTLMTVTNNSAKSTLRHFNAGTYRLVLSDSLGQSSISKSPYIISIFDDMLPHVVILRPENGVVLRTAQQETLSVEVADDFGINKIDLCWFKSSEHIDTVYKKNIKFNKKEKNIISHFVWNLVSQNLYPGDSLFYWISAKDNYPYGGNRTICSDTLFFRLPTFKDIREEVANNELAAEQSIGKVNKSQKKLQSDLESLMRSTKGKKELSWEEKQIVEDMKTSLHEQADSLQNAVEQLKNAIEKLQDQNVNEEILEKMSAVQKALSELIEQYGDSLLFNFDQQENAPSMEDMQKALKNMAEMLPDLNEQLENTLQFLEMLKKESQRALLAQMALEQAKNQMQLANNKNDDAEKMRKQNALNKDIDELKKQINEQILDDTASPVGENQIPSFEQIKSQQQVMKQQMQSGSPPSKSDMNSMSGMLSRLSSELQSTLSSSMAAQKEKDRQLLLQIAMEVKALVEWQKDIMQSHFDSDNLKFIARQQQELVEALKHQTNLIDSLKAVSPRLLHEVFTVTAHAKTILMRAAQLLSSRGAETQMSIAQEQLNLLAATLLEISDKMSQSSGASGMMSGLQRLSGKQAMVNGATSQILQKMLQQGMGKNPGKQGSGGSNGESGNSSSKATEKAKKAAQQAQEEIANQLKKLREKYGDQGDSRLKKRVEELEREARSIARQLENPQQDIEERQNHFLSRMLQATLSIHKQEEGKEERISKSAINQIRQPSFNSDKTDKFNRDTFFKLRMQALLGNFPSKYRKQVQAYFDRLGEVYLKEK